MLFTETVNVSLIYERKIGIVKGLIDRAKVYAQQNQI